jgi:hypothetical protein
MLRDLKSLLETSAKLSRSKRRADFRFQFCNRLNVGVALVRPSPIWAHSGGRVSA